MDAISLLETQHRNVEALFSKIEKAENPEEQIDLFAQLADAFLVHARIEEEIFYPAVYEERTEEELREAVEEHLQAKRIVADLIELDPSDEQWTAKCSVLREDIRHHVREEEHTLFPLVRKELTKKRLAELGSEMSALAQELKSRPEPRRMVFGQIARAAELPSEA